MIKNERQLATAKKQLAVLRKAANALQSAGPSDPMNAVRISSLEADAEKLNMQIETYNKASEGIFDVACLTSVEHVGEELINARIASGLTQEQLAKKASLEAQQIQRWESTLYQTTNLKTLKRIKDIIMSSIGHEKNAVLCGCD
ncbi:helix-turn-helix transcriptional regulator [Methylocystis sp. H4A]|uniref:helix-turn-helix domain-containing protein n=1 Tax=Methylocystis sp. H4A TaxID=2785788 RepID=UPI0018C32827|nr:helix-turn-helix transcriptional regulator [Methylocystis sp. H4A]MBG0800527.1 helix-turn-helix transcriptional regulator [Methylocystis sp. H4A]